MDRNDFNDDTYLVLYKTFLEELMNLIIAYQNGYIEFNFKNYLQYVIEQYDDIKEYLSN